MELRMTNTYDAIGASWPEPMPVPTNREAIAGVKRLIKVAHRHAREEGIHFGLTRYSYKLTSGRRHTWPRRGTWYVNPDERNHGGGGGWGEIVHSVSHWAMRKYWPEENPHGPRHVWIEKLLADYAIKNFLGGRLVRPLKEKPPVNMIDVRAARVAKRIKLWEAKRRRADNAIRKLRKQERYYARRANAPSVSMENTDDFRNTRLSETTSDDSRGASQAATAQQAMGQAVAVRRGRSQATDR